jgi:hypothetical protein
VLTDCSQDFIRCSLQQPSLQTCSRSLVFAKSACQPPAFVPECNIGGISGGGNRPKPGGGNSIHLQPGGPNRSPGGEDGSYAIFCTRLNDGFYRHPTNCSKFFQCYQTTTFVMTCSPGTVFNPDPKVITCDFPQNVPDCQLADILGEVSGRDAECDGQPHGAFLKFPGDCHQYIRCVWKRKVVHSCPANLVFNINLNICDYPSAVPECSISANR